MNMKYLTAIVATLYCAVAFAECPHDTPPHPAIVPAVALQFPMMRWQSPEPGRFNLVCQRGTYEGQVVSYVTKNHDGKWDTNGRVVGEYDTLGAAMRAEMEVSYRACAS